MTIADLADLAGLTESHLIRAFHREFGLPPHAYHLRRRLAAASELLASGLSVSTVAYECGFADQSHLSRKFKEVYGLTPAAWATAVAAGSRRKAPTKVVSIGMPRRDTHVARVMQLVKRQTNMETTMSIERWEIDSSRSGIRFAVRHPVLSKTRGRFSRWSGTADGPGRRLHAAPPWTS